MLSRTPHPLFSQFHQTFSCSIPPTSTTSAITLVPFSSHLCIQAETEMEYVEAAALKTSFRKEMTVKSTPQSVSEDLSPGYAQNGVGCDDFFVDELLDLSNEDGFVKEELTEEEEEDKGFISVSHQQDHQNSNTNITFSAKDEFGSELSVPTDDLANLEWLFVEDSFPEFCTPNPDGGLTEKSKNEGPEPEPLKPCFKSPVPAKARSKRTRTGGRVWSLGSPSLTESSSSSTSSTSSSSPSSTWLIYPTVAQNDGPVQTVYSEEKPLAQKLKKTPMLEAPTTGSGGAQPPRRCSHCGVQKTPQWRTGPLGAKTLCNACGVRFKSGRLLPEYRPACSPTFSSELHSNHHRKVLEMRRKKESPGVAESDLAAQGVSSF